MATKICSQCKNELDFSNFSPNGDRLRSNCKECQAKKRSDFVLKNKDKVLAQNKKSYLRNRDSILDKKKEYYIENQEKILDAHKEYYIKNKDLILLKVKKYKRLYPEVYRASNAKRRAIMAGSVGNVTSDQILSLKIQYNYCCAYCGCMTDDNNPLHIDHMIPLSKGGLHVIENLLPACRLCNLKKSTMDWGVWSLLIGFKL